MFRNFLGIFHSLHGEKYTLLDKLDLENPIEDAKKQVEIGKRSRWIYVATSLGILSILFFVSYILGSTQPQVILPSACTKPQMRREWRSLTLGEKDDFIQAVVCLSTVPSRWKSNGTLYDDFTFLHGNIGSWSHRSASFLPWHRYTLFIWENALREKCGFSGNLPYWDWTVDWMNLAESSIWSNTTGFGGDGDPNGTVTVGKGRCVPDGPFAQLRPIMYNHTYEQHCLSRGFRDGEVLGQLPGHVFAPNAVGEIIRKSSYKEFVQDIEYRLHNVMHAAIAGDFLALTAANDPIFFVHHTQLDHLWWQWQQEDTKKRLVEYDGKHMHNSTEENASVDNFLIYGGFVDDIPVSEVMDTENDLLCYRY